MNRQLMGLYSMLTTGEYLTAEALAQASHVSSKTVRNQLKELGEILARYDARIESKHGTGYRLVAENPEKLKVLEEKLWNRELQQSGIPNSAEERVNYLLEYLLYADEFVRLDDLSEMLYISKKTLTGNLKEVETVLNEHHLTLRRKPNYGIRVEGREFDRRLCIAENDGKRRRIAEQLGGELRMPEEVGWIQDCVQDCLARYPLIISNVAYQDLILHIEVALTRIRSGHCIRESVENPPERADRVSQQMAEEILNRIRDHYGVECPEAEAESLAVHLESRKTLIDALPADSSGENIVIRDEIGELTDYMLCAVYDAFQCDFRSDLELRMSLSQHLIPLIVRLQHDMKLANPLLKEIRERYYLAYTMATTACVVLNRRYHTTVKEDEIAYIALLFELALERKKTEVRKKNVLLVCASGKASAQLMLYRYQTEFGPYLNRIEVCDVGRLAEHDMSDIDYIFTTVPIPVRVPVPIKEVGYFLKGSDVWALKRTLLGGADNTVREIYRRELFLPHMKLRSKDEVLRVCCDYACEHGYADENLISSVRAREAVARTCFGNQVAMPHPIAVVGDVPFVCVALLDEPVLWIEEEPDSLVQAVFLVSVGNSRKYDVQRFYQVTARLFLNEEGMRELIRNQDYETLMRLLTEEEEQAEKEEN